MKFIDSCDRTPCRPRPPLANLLWIEQDNGSMHVGTFIWPCSLIVVKFIECCLLASNPNPNPGYAQVFQFKHKHGIELGTGCGVTKMDLGILGLAMVLTNITLVLPSLKRNDVKKNTATASHASTGKSGSDVGRVKISQLNWNNEKQIQALKPPFDFIVAKDVVYLENIVEPLISTMNVQAEANIVNLLGYQI